MTNEISFYQQLKQRLEAESVVLATIVKVDGSAPRETGAKMLICKDKIIIGTIGGGAGEAKVIQQAMTVLETGIKQLVDVDLTGAPGRDIQGVCGGKVQVWLERWDCKAINLVEQILERLNAGKTVTLITPLIEEGQPYLIEKDNLGDRFSNNLHDHQFLDKKIHNIQADTSATATSDCFIETIQPSPLLLIVGGGHVAVALARIASIAGFQIAITDDRPEFVTSQRFPDALLFLDIGEALNQLSSCSQICIALVTRGYQQDLIALQTIVASSLTYQYIGAIGSQKRIRMIYQALKQREIAIESLKPFYAPIGLDIGALTPEEIAVSICAELIKVRRGGTGESLSKRRSPNPNKL